MPRIRELGLGAPVTTDDPSAETLEVMLQELIEAYKDPAFQKQLEELHAHCFKSGTNPILYMGPVALKVQAPILQKYGSPPSPQGVELLKHAVHRRVAEGASRVEALANEARRLLGIEPMAAHSGCAEQVLVAKLDETNKLLGVGQGRLEAALVTQCRRRIANELASGVLPAKTAAHLEKLLEEDSITVAPVLAFLKMAKVGISLGGIRGINVPSEVPILEAVSPSQFFQTHVLPNRPAVLRGVLDAECFPPLQNLSDMKFLRRLCGHRRVCTKSLAHDDVAGRMVFVTDPELRLPLSAFLDAMEAYERDGTRMPFYLGKVPLRKELPELADEIERAAMCPRRKYGTCFGELIPEGVFTYLGCGRNTTPVHFDGHENLLLCVFGGKRLHLYPPSDAKYLYPCNDFSRSSVVPFARFNDLEEGIREKLALVSHARPIEINLVAGDLLYLPSCWWHCVEGSKEQNMILNWWFNLHPEKKALGHGESLPTCE